MLCYLVTFDWMVTLWMRRLPGKDLDVRKVWRQEEKGTTEDEMDGEGHRSDQHEFDPTPGSNGRQEGLACSGPWGSQRVGQDLRTKQQVFCIKLLIPHHAFSSCGISLWHISKACTSEEMLLSRTHSSFSWDATSRLEALELLKGSKVLDEGN